MRLVNSQSSTPIGGSLTDDPTGSLRRTTDIRTRGTSLVRSEGARHPRGRMAIDWQSSNHLSVFELDVGRDKVT